MTCAARLLPRPGRAEQGDAAGAARAAATRGALTVRGRPRRVLWKPGRSVMLAASMAHWQPRQRQSGWRATIEPVALVGRHRVRRRAMTLPAMAPRFPELQEASWLRHKYQLEGLSSYSIAAQLGCRATTVSRALRRHRITARIGRPAVVVPGQVYGRLTVLGELPERTRGGRVFRCLCAFGRDARAVERRQGKIRSCGCLRDETRQSGQTQPPRVQRGQHYGRLVVLHEAGRASPSDARLFSCGCDCGSTTTVRGANQLCPQYRRLICFPLHRSRVDIPADTDESFRPVLSFRIARGGAASTCRGSTLRR